MKAAAICESIIAAACTRREDVPNLADAARSTCGQFSLFPVQSSIPSYWRQIIWA